MFAKTGCHWELFGIAVTILGLAVGYVTFGGSGSVTYVPNAIISGLGVLITLVAALAHSVA